jgi:glc operon protein GlcG
MQQINTLSQTDVIKIINAISQEFQTKGLKGAGAVVDAHGELLGFIRGDGCPLSSINIAINKAFTASRERQESKAIGDRTGSPRFHMTNYGDLRYTAWGGGVPVIYKGECVGAIGVSGLSEDEDIAIAKMGAALVV